MKHLSPQEIADTDRRSLDGILPMSRRERLMRWADALDRHGGSLNALVEIEYLPVETRRAYSGTNTPLTIAFNDATLREEGLASDKLGDAMDFFEMTDEDAHRLLCDCNYLGSMTGQALAHRIRAYAEPNTGGIWSLARAIVSRGN